MGLSVVRGARRMGEKCRYLLHTASQILPGAADSSNEPPEKLLQLAPAPKPQGVRKVSLESAWEAQHAGRMPLEPARSRRVLDRCLLWSLTMIEIAARTLTREFRALPSLESAGQKMLLASSNVGLCFKASFCFEQIAARIISHFDAEQFRMGSRRGSKCVRQRVPGSTRPGPKCMQEKRSMLEPSFGPLRRFSKQA